MNFPLSKRSLPSILFATSFLFATSCANTRPKPAASPPAFEQGAVATPLPAPIVELGKTFRTRNDESTRRQS